jgi:predicted ATPase
VALLVGEGIGKSRLLMEFHRRVDEQVSWWEGRALSFGRSTAVHPLIDMLRRAFAIEQHDSEADIIEKVEHSVLALDVELKPALPYLRNLLSVDAGEVAVASMDPRLRRAEIFEWLRHLILRSAERHPVVLVYEELHCIDQASEQLRRFLLNSVPAARVLLILTFRPDYAYPLGQCSFQSWIALNPLSTYEGAKMADALVGSVTCRKSCTSLSCGSSGT